MSGIIIMIFIAPLVCGFLFVTLGLPILIDMLPFLIGLFLGILLLRIILGIFWGMAESNNIFVKLLGLIGIILFFVLLVSFCTL